MSVLSSREFNRNVSAAKRAARIEPVVITDRGDPEFVLLSIEEYRRLKADEVSLADFISMPEGTAIEVEFEPLNLNLKIPSL